MIFYLLLFATMPLDLRSVHRVDTCELNHYYDGDGREVLRQVILWDAHPEEPCVVCWWMACNCDIDQQRKRVITRDHREFRFDSFHETHTQHDPELANRARWPAAERRFPQNYQ